MVDFIKLKSLAGCRLKIGSYPHFDYDARNGGGKASLISSGTNHIQNIELSQETFSIPPLSTKTARFLGLPLPPGIKISMHMEKLSGTINRDSGEILLAFQSRFIFTISSIFRFPDLFVKTSLTTGKVKSELHEEEGLVLQKNGKTTLVGIAIIPVTNNTILNLFLNLPNEALAVLKCEIE